ncbi:MAG TPA: hypothetical protein VM031_03925 [Phycisphaerae bacterium]|nr:hypothetical protein [Phycisphaerae bacterium]
MPGAVDNMPRILTMLPWVVYGALVAFLVTWLVLLIGCLRRQRFWPVLDTDRHTKWFWLATFALVNPVLTAMYYVFGRRRLPDATNVRVKAVPIGLAAAVVAIAGFLVNFPGVTHLWMTPFLGRAGDRPGDAARFSAHAATIEAQNSTNSTTVSSSTNHTRFACRSVAVIHEGDDRLGSTVAASLRDALAELPFVESAELYADGRFPADGRRRPDVFVLLTVRNVRTTPIPYAVGLQAEVDISAGRSPWGSTSSYHDGSDPPLLDFHWSATVRHRSTTVGYESVRHGLAAKSIAKEAAEPLAKAFKQWLEKHGPPPELPEGFYGTYRPLDLPGPLKALGCKRMCSYSGLFTHNETFWRFEAAAEDVPGLLKRLRDELKQDGWGEMSTGEGNLRMKKEPVRLHIYRPSERVRTGWVVVEDPNAKPPVGLIVHLRDRFPEAERSAVTASLLADTTPVDTLMFFSRLFDDEQQQRLYELLEAHPGGSLDAQVELIDHYVSAKDHDKAAASIRRARALLWAVHNDGDYRSRIDSAAKTLAKQRGEEPAKPPPPTAEDFRAAGFREVDANTPPFELEVALNEPVLLFHTNRKGETRTFSARVSRSAGPKATGPYAVTCLECSGSSRSWSTESSHAGTPARWTTMHTWRRPPDLTVEIILEAADGKDRFKVTVRPGR